MVASARAVDSVASGLPFGEVPWGTSLCQLHQGSQELLDAHVPFLAAGLANNERCLWVTPPAIRPGDAQAALAVLVPDLDRHFASGQLELVDGLTRDPAAERALAWFAELDRALASGYVGLRIATCGPDPELQRGLRDRRIIALCSYPLDRCTRDELTELLHHHETALLRRGDTWDQVHSVTAALAIVRPPIAEHQTREHLVALQRVTSALCEAATFPELAAVVATEVQQILGASKLALAIGNELVMLRGVTTPDDPAALASALERAPASWGVPAATEWMGAPWVAVLPLVSGAGVRVGTLVSGFADREPVQPQVRALAEDVARQLASTVVRAHAREQAERERQHAEAANTAKDQFLAMLGHELRNPLSPILTATQLMLLRAPDACVKERTIIERSVARMIRLVDDLLDISRIAGGRIELARQEVDLAVIVATALERTGSAIKERSHRVTVTVPTGLTVDADPARIVQVLVNLLSNAAKYTKAGGAIDIAAQRSGDTIELAISDTGIGLPRELLARVFELFVQGAQSDRPKGGLGLGLPLARKIVELHGGTIRAESGGTNLGSRFVVTLPTRPARAEVAAPEDGKRRILVVDDNEDAAWLLAEGLRVGGHDVRVSHDGLDALELAREFLPQIAFLDVGLPGLDGYALCEQLLALSVRPKVVAVTGYGQAADRERARAAGFDLHFVKPVSLREMQSAVETFSKT